jgi:hypothetical protein
MSMLFNLMLASQERISIKCQQFFFCICEKFHTQKMQYNYIIKFQFIFSSYVQILVSQTSKKALANGNVGNQWRKFYVLNLEQFNFLQNSLYSFNLGEF